MPLPPFTTPVPRPVFMPGISYQVDTPVSKTTTSTAAPMASALPSRPRPGSGSHREDAPDPTPSDTAFPAPKLRLEVRDLNHEGADVFISSINVAKVFGAAVQNVLRLLYISPDQPNLHPTPTRSVTLILRDMGGVAYTTGSDLDDDHKEIHFSLSYIAGIDSSRRAAEITGVLTHELVHCYQWNGKGACPGGLVEGVADWVRLHCDLSPPHWKREASGKWDGGYQHTAYFLEYLEKRFGDDTVRRINETLRTTRYEEKTFWTGLVGRPVEQLWEDYKKKLKEDDPVGTEQESEDVTDPEEEDFEKVEEAEDE